MSGYNFIRVPGERRRLLPVSRARASAYNFIHVPCEPQRLSRAAPQGLDNRGPRMWYNLKPGGALNEVCVMFPEPPRRQ